MKLSGAVWPIFRGTWRILDLVMDRIPVLMRVETDCTRELRHDYTLAAALGRETGTD